MDVNRYLLYVTGVAIDDDRIHIGVYEGIELAMRMRTGATTAIANAGLSQVLHAELAPLDCCNASLWASFKDELKSIKEALS